MVFSEGFPDNSKFTTVPNLLFGPLLEKIDDLRVLKCILRILWLHSQKKGFPRYLTWDELISDRTLARALSTADSSHNNALEATLGKAVQLGVIIHLKVEAAQHALDLYMPNSQEGRRAAKHIDTHEVDAAAPLYRKPQPSSLARHNIFSLYEENIGIIGHIMAEELKEAERNYPQEWIEEAFREAVVRNKRSWRYIEAILKGWTAEGRDYGESGRHSKKVDAREWIRRHGLPRPSP
ncbi:DnaD domain protein [SAR202 cluster bacterium AC-647-N09_OGT_505m]|nr:DnaD domain protein [SAR202 cluster bacterium AC-647-N09_OGT_505m]